MADLVKFFVGNQENLDNLQKIKGQLVIALDTSNSTSPKGTLYYDYNSTQRVKLSSETAEKAIGDETGLNIRSNYLTSVEGNRNNSLYTITAKTGSGVTKNTFNIPINLVGSSATSSKIFLLGAITQSNDANNSYTNNNFYIENNILNGTFKGNITGKATTAGTADVALSVGWNNISDKPTNSIVSQIYKDTKGLNYKTLNGNVTNLGLFAPLDSNSKTIPIEYIPKSAIERLFKVTSLEYLMANVDEFPDLNLGDTILDLSDNIMYYIIGSDLTSADSYQEYSAGIASAVEWSNILNKPTTLVSSFLTNESTTAFTITPRAYTGSNLTAITVPFANTSRAGLITTLAQSFAGNKTFMGDITIGSNTDSGNKTFFMRRKNSSNNDSGVFSVVIGGTANYASIGFQYNKADGTSDDYNLLMSNTNLRPWNNNDYDLGTSSNKFRTVYATTFNGNATTATRATSDGSGNNINTTYVKSVTGASGTGYTITVTKGNGSTSSFTIPLATTGGLGLVSTGAQTFAGAKTFASTVTATSNFLISNTDAGYYLKDKKGKTYAGIYDNSANFWIGSASSGSGSHYGNTYLSTGFDDNDEGYDSFYVSIPHVDEAGKYSSTVYWALHSGNWKSYISDWRSLSWTNGTTAGPVPVFTDRVGGGKTNGAAIPVATSAVSGVVSTGSQTFAGDKNFTGTVAFVKTADASGVSGNYPAVIIGGAATSAHLELDANEIMAKGSINSVAPLYLNNEGGAVDIGPGGMNVRGHITAGATTKTLDIGTSSNTFRNIYASSFSGNAATATKLQTARSINGTAFDGSKNITTTNWGTARNITITDYNSSHTGTATSVNGSSNITLKLPNTITAALSGNAATATRLQTSRKINGVLFNGSSDINTYVAQFSLGAPAGSTGWSKLGTWSNTEQCDTCYIWIFGGNGQNGQPYQNGELHIFIKDGYQTTSGATGAFGVTVTKYTNADDYEVQVRATSSNSCEVWVKAPYTYSSGKYIISIPTDTTWVHAGTYTSTEPTNGTLQSHEYFTILNNMSNAASATKLQTARTIRTNLSSTSTASFDGTVNITPGVSGVLPVACGGTGATSASTARTNLGITPANIGAYPNTGGTLYGNIQINTSITNRDNPTKMNLVFNSSQPASGVTVNNVNAPGIGFHIANTGWCSIKFVPYEIRFLDDTNNNYIPIRASTYYGSGSNLTNLNASNITSGTLPITRGGTGSTTASGACSNLGAVTISTSQTITGAKVFKGNITIQNNGTAPTLSFQSNNTALTTRTATIYNNLVSATGSNNFLYFRLYRRETGGAVTSYYEEYRLPTATANRASNRSYEILTSKVAVTVGQGGTGTDTRGAQDGGALANLGCVYSTSEPMTVYEGMVWLKPVT